MVGVQVKQISEIQNDFSDAEFEFYAQKEYIHKKLSEAKKLAADKDTVWLDEEEFWNGD
ncbi:hypothetical protein FACS189485_05570 [Spirochaetia bacterium]|nr:hypothetical protein FACS189485_05570 [Spirochaetia bacterium]